MPQQGRHAPIPKKERRKEQANKKMKKKRIKAQRMKPHTPILATDALIGDE